MKAAKRSRSSRQTREAADFEIRPSPAFSQSDSTSRIERPRTNASAANLASNSSSTARWMISLAPSRAGVAGGGRS
ncbi:MAG: hypothetical protein ACLGI5_04520 [Thermoleophilia bacterium]